MTRPPASISLDLDNLWSYMKIHGDAGWDDYPSYLDPLVDVVLERLERHGLIITIFIVGRDAALPKNAAALRKIADAGHEIGNHSLSHEPWFHRYSFDEAEREIAESEEHIFAATGQRPRGYRGPGFSLSHDALRILRQRGYRYDCSTFPTFIGPLARAYYFWNTRNMAAEEREKRDQLYGTMAEGLRPIRPYLWDLGDGELLEIPVTTMPLTRVPLHMSYLIYLASFSKVLFRAYLHSSLAMCRAAGVELSFLLHPLDFVGGDVVQELSFFPGMNRKTEDKLCLLDEALEAIQGRFTPITMGEHADRALSNGHLERRKP